MRGYPRFSFWIPIGLAEMCFSRIVINRNKNTSVLEGTVLKLRIYHLLIHSFFRSSNASVFIITNIIKWLAPRVGKMSQFLRCDWLPEGEDGAILPARDYPLPVRLASKV